MPAARPYLIGLTGGMAGGKSAVADMLSDRGAHVIDADQVSRDLVSPGAPMLDRLVQTWGQDILTAEGELDRKALASRVFGDDAETRRLNAITHPAILDEMLSRVAKANADVVVFMAPLLFEAGGERLMDEVWVVTADADERVRRALARDGLSEVEARARMASQLPTEVIARGAHVVLQNDGSLSDLERQVESNWQSLQERLRKRR